MIDFALFESLLKCQTVEQLHAQTTLITQQMGFQHFFYGVELNPVLTPPYQLLIINGYPEEWVGRYFNLGYQNVDPVVKFCLQQVTPVLWEYLDSLPPEAEKVMDEAKDFGLANGVTFPLSGLQGESGLLSVAVERNTKQTRKDIFHVLGGAQLLANYLHDSVNRIVLSRGQDDFEQKLIECEQLYFQKMKKRRRLIV